MSEDEKKAPPRLAPPLETVAILDQVAMLKQILDIMRNQRPEGIVEPLEPIVATTNPVILIPPKKPWFSVTIVKEGDAELNVMINDTDIKKSKPYKMGVNEVVYDIVFNEPVIKEVMLWTVSGTCTVKIRGAR